MDDETKPKQPWTQGEWRLTGPVGRAGWIESEANGNIAAVHKIATPEGGANGVLIAAAPAMARALALFVRTYDRRLATGARGAMVYADPPEIAAARAALNLCGWNWGGR